MKRFRKTLIISAIVVGIALTIFVLKFWGATTPIEFGNDAARDLATKTILADRAKTIANLEEIVKRDVDDPNKQDATKAAMVLLGQLHAEEAAPLLAEHVSFLSTHHKFSMPSPPMSAFHPAASALIKIGLPSVDALLYKAANTDDRKDDYWTNVVIREMLGKQPAIVLVNDRISDQHDERQKQRLRALLVKLQKAWPDRRVPIY